MELSSEEENFVKITKIVLEVVPKYLRKCFIEQWNKKYPMQKWQSNNVSGNFLFNELSQGIKNSKARAKEIEKLKEGKESEWDTTTLVFVMVDAGLNLIEGSRSKDQRSRPLRISEEIDVIRNVRNSFFAHKSSMQCSSCDFTDMIASIKCTSMNIFGGDAVKDVEEIEKSEIQTQLTAQRKIQLNVEMNRNKEYCKLVEGFKGGTSLKVVLIFREKKEGSIVISPTKPHAVSTSRKVKDSKQKFENIVAKLTKKLNLRQMML